MSKNKTVKKKPVKNNGWKPLTPQQERFCHEYIKDYNGTQAAIRAHYSPKSARKIASHLWTKVDIRGKINALIKEQFDNIKADVHMVLQGLCSAANIDIRMAYDEDGNLLPIKDIPEPLAKAITEIRTEELFDGQGKDRKHIGTAKTIKITDRMRARELIGKYRKMFIEVMEHRGIENLAEQIKKARQRREQAECKNSPKKKK